MGRRVIARGGLDDPGEQRGLPRLQLFDAELVAGRAAAAVVRSLAEVGLRGRLDPVGAVAEVDRVEVGGDDLFLRPLVRELVGERGLAELLEDRAVRLGLQRVLDELLLDRRGALDGAFVADVVDERARDPADVDRRCSVSKRLSSIEITASLTIWGICEGVTITRFCWLSTPIGWPRSSSRSELCSFLNCENCVSDGRSEATATNMPKTNEIEAEQQHGEEDQQEAQPLQARPAAGRRVRRTPQRRKTLPTGSCGAPRGVGGRCCEAYGPA